MAKTTVKLPAGLKLAHTNDRKEQPMLLAFVDKEAGIFASRKGAIARDRTMEGLVAKANAKIGSLTRVSRTPAVQPAKQAKGARPAANADLESID